MLSQNILVHIFGAFLVQLRGVGFVVIHTHRPGTRCVQQAGVIKPDALVQEQSYKGRSYICKGEYFRMRMVKQVAQRGGGGLDPGNIQGLVR